MLGHSVCRQFLFNLQFQAEKNYRAVRKISHRFIHLSPFTRLSPHLFHPIFLLFPLFSLLHVIVAAVCGIATAQFCKFTHTCTKRWRERESHSNWYENSEVLCVSTYIIHESSLQRLLCSDNNDARTTTTTMSFSYIKWSLSGYSCSTAIFVYQQKFLTLCVYYSLELLYSRSVDCHKATMIIICFIALWI